MPKPPTIHVTQKKKNIYAPILPYYVPQVSGGLGGGGGGSQFTFDIHCSLKTFIH